MKLQTFRKMYLIITAIAILVLFTISEVKAQEPSKEIKEALERIGQLSECRATYFWMVHTIGTTYLVEVGHFGDKEQAKRLAGAMDELFIGLHAFNKTQKTLAEAIQKDITLKQLQDEVLLRYKNSMVTIQMRIMGIDAHHVRELKIFLTSFKKTKLLCERLIE